MRLSDSTHTQHQHCLQCCWTLAKSLVDSVVGLLHHIRKWHSRTHMFNPLTRCGLTLLVQGCTQGSRHCLYSPQPQHWHCLQCCWRWLQPWQMLSWSCPSSCAPLDRLPLPPRRPLRCLSSAPAQQRLHTQDLTRLRAGPHLIVDS